MLCHFTDTDGVPCCSEQGAEMGWRGGWRVSSMAWMCLQDMQVRTSRRGWEHRADHEKEAWRCPLRSSQHRGGP